jgi:hypothetical protein
MSTVTKYPIIGGPLDGAYANHNDFAAAFRDEYNHRLVEQGHDRKIFDAPEGKFYAYHDQYASFNNASGRVHDDWASMIWVYRELLRPSVREPQ